VGCPLPPSVPLCTSMVACRVPFVLLGLALFTLYPTKTDVGLLLLFSSHITRHAQYEHPCAPQYHPLQQQQQFQQQAFHPASASMAASANNNEMLPVHTQFHQPHVLVPANPYLHEGTTTTTTTTTITTTAAAAAATYATKHHVEKCPLHANKKTFLFVVGLFVTFLSHACISHFVFLSKTSQMLAASCEKSKQIYILRTLSYEIGFQEYARIWVTFGPPHYLWQHSWLFLLKLL
jgi:hypothetical protein